MARRRGSGGHQSRPSHARRPVRGPGQPERRRTRRAGQQGVAMKRWMAAVLLCLCWAVHGVAENAEPKWRVNLRERYEFQAFDRTINFRWTLHQDVLFISPDRVLVYQVNRARGPAHLVPRDASGGAGNFTLAIRVLNAQDGKEIKSLDLPTS